MDAETKQGPKAPLARPSTITEEQAQRIALHSRAEEAWNTAYDRSLNADKKAGRPYDRHKYARVARVARAKALGVRP